MSSFRTYSLALAGCALALAVPAAAQDSIDPVDPLEDQALREEARAQFDEALGTFKRAFDTAVRQAASGGAARERNLARAEVLLGKVDSLTETVTSHAETDEFLGGYDDAALGPVLKGQVDWHRARYRLAGGDSAGAAEIASGLGLISEWWVIGPFDNERGRGFATSQPPEKGVDLSATYKGKERDVNWRHVPVKGPLGYVNLDALMRPNDQASAYAAAFVKSAGEQKASVRIGSDEALKAWWNGAEIVSRDVRRPLGFDQDVVGVTLADGWNTLLVKVHDQTGAWGFRARLTAPDGSTLSGITLATSDDDAVAAAATRPQTAFDGDVATGAKGYYEGVVGEGAGAGSRDLFHLGLLHAQRQFDSYADRKAENLLKQAAELEPDNAVFRFHYAEAASPPTEMSVEKEENRQRIARERAIESDPAYAVAYRALAAYYTRSLVNLERAEGLLRKALEVNPEYLEARLDLARVLERRGLAAEAEKMRDTVFDTAGFDGRERQARALALELSRRGQGRAARDAWKEVLRLDARGNDVRRRLSDLAAQALDAEEAAAVLDAIRAVDPFDTAALEKKAALYEGRGEFEEAGAALQEALRIAPEDDGLLRALGRVQLKNGDEETALATFREALRVNPKLQDVERYLEFLDPQAAPYEDDYAIAVEPLIEQARDYQNDENDGWLTLLDQVVNKVNRDGTSSQYIHQAHKILTDSGVKRFDRERAGSWGNQALKWKSARVIKADGSVVDAKTMARGGFGMVDFPPLQPGDVVDFSYRTDEREQGFFGDYFGTTNYFASSVPMLLSTFTLVTPTERSFYFHTKHIDVQPTVTTRDDGETKVYEWTVRNTEKVRSEPGMPSARELFPQVQVTTYESWDAFASWWWSMIRDQHIASDELKAKVAELVADKESREEKIRAIYEFVTGEVTYQAWEFGVHGYKPYTTTAIFDKREGDCKDKAILFNTMLKEIGVEAYPVLIFAEQRGARGEDDLTLAMVGHFNHCISYVPDVDGSGTGRFLDGTAQYGSLELVPNMDRGAKVLVVKPGGAEITTIPIGAPETLGIDQDWNVVVSPDGSAVVEGKLTFRGDQAIGIRRGFSVEGQRPLILQGMLAQVFGRAKLLSQEFSDLKDLTGAEEWMKVRAEVTGFAKESGGSYELPTTFLNALGGLGQMLSRPERQHDLLITNPIKTTVSVRYELPEGWESEAPPKDTDLELDEATFTSKATVDGNALVLSRTMSLRTPRVAKDAYAAFRQAFVDASATLSQTWKVKPAAAPAAPENE